MITGLERISQLHDEGVRPHTAHDIPLCDRILFQILLLDLLFTEDFHGEKFLVLFALDQEDFAKAARSEQLVSNELVWTDSRLFIHLLWHL